MECFIGESIALYNPFQRRFIQMQHHGDIGILCDTSVSPENLEPWRCWERFTIIDAGNARIALYSWTFRRFVRVLPDGKVDGKAGVIGIDALPPESVWSAERFSMISVENNLYMFCNPASNRFLSLRDSKVVGCHGPSDTDRPSAQFQVVMHLDPLPSLMKKLCGRSVALYNPFHQRFIKMQHNGDIGVSDKASINPDTLEAWRVGERFIVTDTGNSKIALYNSTFRRFVRVLHDGTVDGKGGVLAMNELPPESVWGAERFSIISTEHNLYLFCNPASNRFLSLRDSKVVGCHGPSENWQCVLFNIVVCQDPSPNLMKRFCGQIFALYNPFHQRFIKMQHNGDIGVSDKASINPDTLEAWRVGERFIVTDTGNSKIALYNSTFRRFVRVLHDGTVDGKGGVLAMNELPRESLWFGERFLGFHVENDLYMFCNPASNRFLSLRDSKVVGCHGLSDTDRPSAQFQVIFQLLPDAVSAITKEEVVSTGACDNEIVASETMGVKAPRSSIDPMLAANRIIPTAFLCPITHELMRDPVILVDGHTYERRAIVDWLDLGKVTSPVTNEQLQNAVLIPNYALRSAISLFLNS